MALGGGLMPQFVVSCLPTSVLFPALSHREHGKREHTLTGRVDGWVDGWTGRKATRRREQAVVEVPSELRASCEESFDAKYFWPHGLFCCAAGSESPFIVSSPVL